jgi:hypothetical protein
MMHYGPRASFSMKINHYAAHVNDRMTKRQIIRYYIAPRRRVPVC